MSLLCYISEDVLRSDRANGNPVEADTSNFLHPVLYYYRELPTNACTLINTVYCIVYCMLYS